MKAKMLFAAAIAVLCMSLTSCKQDEPFSGNYIEPYLEWGASPSKVMDEMQKLGYTCKSFSEQSYTSSNKESYVRAAFDNSKLYAYYIGFNTAIVSYYELNAFLGGKYTLVTETGTDSKQYTTKDGKTYIFIENNATNGSCEIIYYDVAMYD